MPSLALLRESDPDERIEEEGLKHLAALLKMKCEQFETAQKLVASAAEIERLAAHGEDADVRALGGWRREVFGEDALKLRRGEIALAIEGKKLKPVPIDAA